MANRKGTNGSSDQFSFLGLQDHCRWWQQPWKQMMLAPWKESYDKPRKYIKKQRDPFADKGSYSQNYVFFPVVMYGYERWLIRMAECHRTNAFELWCWKRIVSLLDCMEIKLVNAKGNQLWIFIGRTDSEAPTLWPPDAKNWLIRKNPDAGEDWGQEEKGVTEDEIVG